MAPEPVPIVLIVNNVMMCLYDPLISLMQRRDVYPGEHETVNVVTRFDKDEECYGWSNESYYSTPPWRIPKWRLPGGRYLVKVTIISSGDKCEGIFRFINDVAVNDFRLEECQPGERAKVLG